METGTAIFLWAMSQTLSCTALYHSGELEYNDFAFTMHQGVQQEATQIMLDGMYASGVSEADGETFAGEYISYIEGINALAVTDPSALIEIVKFPKPAAEHCMDLAIEGLEMGHKPVDNIVITNPWDNDDDESQAL